MGLSVFGHTDAGGSRTEGSSYQCIVPMFHLHGKYLGNMIGKKSGERSEEEKGWVADGHHHLH